MNNSNKVLFGKQDQSITIIDFLKENNKQNKNTIETFVPSHGMTLQQVCPCSNKDQYANGPRAIGPVSDGYPKRLLGGADTLGIDYKDDKPVLSQKQVSMIDYSRVPKYNFPIPEVRL